MDVYHPEIINMEKNTLQLFSFSKEVGIADQQNNFKPTSNKELVVWLNDEYIALIRKK